VTKVKYSFVNTWYIQ